MTRSGKILGKMFREEWRMHSNIFKGRSFAFFPLIIFTFTLIFSFITFNYSTLNVSSLGRFLVILSGFLGLGVGNLGFSSNAAEKNFLGKTNFIIYSSRTLPLNEKYLLILFIIKDIIYYFVFFLLPIGFGGLIGTSFSILNYFWLIFPAFFLALIFSVALTRSSLKLTVSNFLQLKSKYLFGSLVDKSIKDVLRSSGGLLKILFSMGVVTGFYWYLVIFFPVTRVFLNNPLLSFSIILGLINLSVYNWLNRFDDIEDYFYLPVGRKKILIGKEKAYLVLTVPLTFIFISISYLVFPGFYLLSIITGLILTVYNLAIAVYTTGLAPNEELFNSTTFLKYLFLENLIGGPLLALSVLFRPSLAFIYLFVLLVALAYSILYLYFLD